MKKNHVSGLIMASLIFLSVSVFASSGDVVIKSEIVGDYVIADGESVYELHVLGDTTAFVGVEFISAEWDVVVPDYVTIVGAELPSEDNPSSNAEDFFFDILMDPSWNRVDASVSSGELTDNTRLTDSVFAGVADKGDKLLGIYYFTVSEDAPVGESGFGLNGVEFLDTNFNQYNVLNDLAIENELFTILREPEFEITTEIRDVASGLEVSEVSADGSEYLILVRVDSRDDPDFEISSIEWDTVVSQEDHFSIVEVRVPSGDDFFDGFVTSDLLQDSIVDGELEGNERVVSESSGPSDSEGILVELVVRVRPDARWEIGSVDVNDVRARVGFGQVFVSEDLGGTIRTVGSEYQIVKPEGKVKVHLDVVEDVVLADGESVYEMIVHIDSEDFAAGGQKMQYIKLAISVPEDVVIVNADLPSSGNDFFGDLLMGDDSFGSENGALIPTEGVNNHEILGTLQLINRELVVSSGETSESVPNMNKIVRFTQASSEGASPISGEFARFYFTASESGEWRVREQFAITGVLLKDTGGNFYRGSDSVISESDVFSSILTSIKNIPNLFASHF